MFDQTFVPTHAHTRKPWTIAASLGVQTIFVVTLLLVPILHPEILHPKLDPAIFVRLRPIREVKQVEIAHSPSSAAHIAPRAFTAPPKIPDRISRIIDTNATAMSADGLAPIGPVSGQTGAILSDLIGAGIPTEPPPAVKAPPQVKSTPAPTGPLHVSQGVQGAKLIFGPRPQYPVIARTARVQGTVRIQAVIAPDGAIGNLKVIGGPPLLINAAVEAVSRWRYRPTLLNGSAVEVLTEIDVIFSLAQ